MPQKMERFTQRARRVLSHAQEEALNLRHNYIGTEHMLIGLIRETGGVASRVLTYLKVNEQNVRELIEQMSPASTYPDMMRLDLSPDTKKLLELAVNEARRMGHSYIGTEHLLLGMVQQPEGVAVDILKRLGATPEEIRRQTRRVMEESPLHSQREEDPAQRRVDLSAHKLQFVVRANDITTNFSITFQQLGQVLDALQEGKRGKLYETDDNNVHIEISFPDDKTNPPPASSEDDDS